MIIKRLSVALRRQEWSTVTVEFLLVVLGVLFALQLDNWNEQRKDRTLFQDYLVQLQVSGNEDLLGVINAMAEIQQRTGDDSRDTAMYAGKLLDRLEQFQRDQG